MTALAEAITSGLLPTQYFIIGDEAFSCTEQMLSPYSGRGLGKYKDSFNYWLSHSRQAIERAFGMLVMRWGILWRKFVFSFERWPLVVLVAMKLHNFCLERLIEVPTNRYWQDIEVGDELVVIDNNDGNNTAVEPLLGRSNRRQLITENLERLGKGRPPHAVCNSRTDR